MQFLNPIWFFALAALSIPVIIHLWNVRPGKTLKVGSISLITEASKSSRRSLKLLDMLLLMIRCLLLALLAALLAAPVWQRVIPTQKAKGWMLIPKEIFKETYQKYQSTVDSLDKAGYEFHYFNKGFAKQDLKIMLADTSLNDTITNANYWSLVKQLDNIAGNVHVYLFTQNGISHFKGSKPNIKYTALHWQTYTAKDSVDRWIEAATFTNDNNIKVTDGFSSPHSTVYNTSILKSGGDAVHDVLTQNGQTSISLKNNNTAPVTVDTSTLRIVIYTNKYQVDAGYLKAALSATTAFNGAKSTIKQYSNPAAIPAGQTWLFWLSDQPVKASLFKSSKSVFRYQAGKASDVNSWIDPGHIALSKRTSPVKTYDAVWKDGFGNPILSSNSNDYQFYSHFDPLWNDLVWSDEFPKMMLKLLFNNKKSQSQVHERRVLNNAQLQPALLSRFTPISLLPKTEQADLSKYFWLLLVILFIAERILSHKKSTGNG